MEQQISEKQEDPNIIKRIVDQQNIDGSWSNKDFLKKCLGIEI